ncbi:MAG: hypothetical protein EON59_00670 [Alphaproteobacteria bacterium]|nr:MAG: hypothetical protein EON59_00670 [Alphaproteobacteria bacterium]
MSVHYVQNDSGYSYTAFPQVDLSEWHCALFPGEQGSAVIIHPKKGGEPNAFHRKMQELVFGVRWIRTPSGEAA